MAGNNVWVVDPEQITIPIMGDCGHEMQVALARVGDGQEFACPVCGATDSLDQEAVQACRAEIDRMVEDGKVGGVANVVKAFLDQTGENAKS
jgi:hypothetical protein